MSTRSNHFRDLANRLQAGIPAPLVWASIESPEAAAVARRVAAGLSVHDAVAELPSQGDWSVAREVWLYSVRTGAPMAQTFTRIAESCDHYAEALAARETAATGARMTLRILVGLPLAGIVLSGVTGLDVAGFYLGSIFGGGVFVTGVGLLWLGWRGMQRIIAAVTAPCLTTGMLADLASVTVRSGVGVREILTSLPRLATEWDSTDEMLSIRQLVERSHGAGSPLGPILDAEAVRRRSESRHRVHRDIEALPTRLLIPTGLCLLPAFIVLTVVPTVILMARVALG